MQPSWAQLWGRVTDGHCLGPACVVTWTKARPRRRPVQGHQSQPPGPCPGGGSRWEDNRGWGGGSRDTHVRRVPRPPSSGDDDVLGRKQSLGRNRESCGQPRHPTGTSRGLHCVPVTLLPCGGPERGLSTGRTASQFIQHPQWEGLHNPTRPCWAGRRSRGQPGVVTSSVTEDWTGLSPRGMSCQSQWH